MPTKKVYIDEIGECILQISRRSTRIRISIRPFDGVRVNIPAGLSFRHGIRFVEDKKRWILKTREKFAAIEKQKTVFLPDSTFTTRFHRLEMKPVQRTTLHASILKDRILVTYPQSMDPREPQLQEFVEKVVIEALRKEAKMYLPDRLHALATQHGFSYENVYIKNLKSRWGSCSGRNNINLNLHLMRLPDDLIDYVLLHELTHTKHKNHSAAFWQALDTLTNSRAKEFQGKLRKFNVHF